MRVCVTIRDRNGRVAEGWGETPLSIQWAWPSDLPYTSRLGALKKLCLEIAQSWVRSDVAGHPMELGYAFQLKVLPELLRRCNSELDRGSMPNLAALVAASAFDIALHDAYGILLGVDTYRTYTPEYMNHDLATYLEPEPNSNVNFHGKYPSDFVSQVAAQQLPVWHLVGGLDPLSKDDMNGAPLPVDGYPVLLSDWIVADGLKCLKVKLRGNDSAWDFERLIRVGELARAAGVEHLSADFNCMVAEPKYVLAILDRLSVQYPEVYDMILYLEQPFPYDLEANQIDVHSISQRKPLFLDESADDWRRVRLGRSLGWTGVALKTCKSQTGALLSLCWAKAHQMPVMVQDLTNPMLAYIPHVRLAAYAETLMGVEANATQFYPDASAHEAEVHPGLYSRREGMIDLSTLGGPGFGYRLDQMDRELPEPTVELERTSTYRLDTGKDHLSAPAFASVFPKTLRSGDRALASEEAD